MIHSLKSRATLYRNIRNFFAVRGVLEVETPLLCQYTVTDPHIESFVVPVNKTNHYFLQTSPEYAMKRLLANGSGSIYQITKSFRVGETGRQHNPEFTLLEWYRIGFNHHDLMDELDALLQFTINTKPSEKISYQDLFLTHFNIDPFTIEIIALKKIIEKNHIQVDVNNIDHDTALQILLTHLIEPQLGIEKPLFLYDFPPSQAALAIIRNDNPRVAERFELYINGSEIANGFHELTDPTEQENRFIKNQNARRKNKQFVPEIDYHFINALKKGIPACAGVAVGLDRLLMQYAKTNNIQEVITFPFETA